MNRRTLSRPNAGFLLPMVLFFSLLFFAAAAIIVTQSRLSNKNLVNLTKSIKSERSVKSGLQQGLMLLNKRLSYLQTRIEQGVIDSDGNVRFISNDDIKNYIEETNGKNHGSFWVDMLNDITENGSSVTYQNNFTLSGEVASFSASMPDYDITVRLIPAFDLAPIEAENTAGYNNVTLRYGYEITATEKDTEYHKSETIKSSLQVSHLDALIQVNLARELSRYNLFAINNTAPDGTPMYDRTSYTGRVYSDQTFYIAGSPTYAQGLEVSTDAATPVDHKDYGTSYTPKKPDGTNALTRVQPVALPSSVDADTQRNLCHRMPWGQNPGAATTPGIYVGTISVAGVTYDAGIYVKNDTGANADFTRIVISVDNGNVNNYDVQRVLSSDHTTVVQEVNNIKHDVTGTKAFLVFSEGQLEIQGMLVNNAYVTVNANDTIYITNDLVYQSGGTSPTTVLGLVAWQGNILVKKDIPPDAGGTLKNLQLHGVLMAIDGGFGAEGWDNNFADYTGYKGTIFHQGAIVRKWSLATLSSDLKKGWGLSTVYDPNLAFQKAPPYFPGSGRYRLLNGDQAKVVDMFLVQD